MIEPRKWFAVRDRGSPPTTGNKMRKLSTLKNPMILDSEYVSLEHSDDGGLVWEAKPKLLAAFESIGYNKLKIYWKDRFILDDSEPRHKLRSGLLVDFLAPEFKVLFKLYL